MPTLVQSNQGEGSFGTSQSFSLPSPSTNGNAIIVAFTKATSNTVSSVTDNAGGSYTLDYTGSNTFGDDVLFYSRKNVTGTPQTFQFTLSSSASPEYAIFEVSGLNNAAGTDFTDYEATGFSTSQQASFTTNSANVCVVSKFWTNSSQTRTTPTNYDQFPSSGSTFFSTLINDDVGAAGAKTIDITLGAADTGAFSTVGYAAAAAGGTKKTLLLGVG